MTAISSELSSFGELLAAFRKRRRLTQQQLAGTMGMHRSAIVRWEQGDFLPQSKTLVLELARHLHLDDQESRHFLEASLTALSPYWLVPFPRNPFFTGREELLEVLHSRLHTGQKFSPAQSYAIQGLGGIGKTQLALEYAYRHALEYSAIFWIRAETAENIVGSLLRIAEVVQLPECEDRDQQRVLTEVQRWLATHSQWLLIWDNVEDPALLERFLPTAKLGAILITTRCQSLGTLARGIDLFPMEQEEGMLFLLRRAKALKLEAESQQLRQFSVLLPHQYAAAAELVATMGGLPLALDQAGAYIEETQCGLPAYLELFRVRHSTLLQQRGDRFCEHPASVATTFALAFTATTRNHPVAGDLLRICALLQPDAIPEELFRQGCEYLGVALEGSCHDTLDWNRVVAGACSYSLLQRQPEVRTLSMHRLVQAALLDAMIEEEQEQWNRQLISTLDVLFPEVLPLAEHSAWEQAERLLPHALLCLSRTEPAAKSSVFASLVSKSARYLYERGQYAQAEPLFLQALQLRERVLSPDHPDVASLLNSLALLFREQGKYAQAEPLFLQALQLRERVLGPEHPEVASSLNSLAALYWSLGRYEQAEQLLQRALYIWEHALGPDHPEVARPLNNLGLIYGMQGKYVQAESLLRRAFSTWERSLGPEHPQVANALHNLAELARDQGKYAQAETLFQRVLHIREQSLGSEHPLVASALHDLAETYSMQSKDEQAELLFQRACAIRAQLLGSEHPLVAESLNGLANLLREQDKYQEAEVLYQRVRAIREQHLGQCHPETAQTLHDLAILHQKQGHLSEAFLLAEHALAIRSQSLGETHPKTTVTRALFTQLLPQHGHTEPGAPSPQAALETVASMMLDGNPEAASCASQERSPALTSQSDQLACFFEARCELHPHAWCRSSDLWRAYVHWAEQQERFPLSRGAFIRQLKAHGCHTDRTGMARLWRGIALLSRVGTKR